MTKTNERYNWSSSMQLEQSFLQADKAISLATDLFNQQLWCWGRDIEHPDGNLLVKYGFTRLTPPPGVNASSIYQLELANHTRIVLRGFGMFLGDDRWGGLFIQRYSFSPHLTPASHIDLPIWCKENLPRLSLPDQSRLPDYRRLLLEIICWIRTYETWVCHNLGLEYRQKIVAEWNHADAQPIPAELITHAWSHLELEVIDHLDWFVPPPPQPVYSDPFISWRNPVSNLLKSFFVFTSCVSSVIILVGCGATTDASSQSPSTSKQAAPTSTKAESHDHEHGHMGAHFACWNALVAQPNIARSAFFRSMLRGTRIGLHGKMG